MSHSVAAGASFVNVRASRQSRLFLSPPRALDGAGGFVHRRRRCAERRHRRHREPAGGEERLIAPPASRASFVRVVRRAGPRKNRGTRARGVRGHGARRASLRLLARRRLGRTGQKFRALRVALRALVRLPRLFLRGAARRGVGPRVRVPIVRRFETVRVRRSSLSARGEDRRSLFLTFSSCLLYTSPSPRDRTRSRMPSSA